MTERRDPENSTESGRKILDLVHIALTAKRSGQTMEEQILEL